MYIVIGAHVCQDCDGPQPVYYGTASDLPLARKRVRAAYFLIEWGVPENGDPDDPQHFVDDAQRDEAHIEATRRSLAATVPQPIGEGDTIWIVNMGEQA